MQFLFCHIWHLFCHIWHFFCRIEPAQKLAHSEPRTAPELRVRAREEVSGKDMALVRPYPGPTLGLKGLLLPQATFAT